MRISYEDMVPEWSASCLLKMICESTDGDTSSLNHTAPGTVNKQSMLCVCHGEANLIYLPVFNLIPQNLKLLEAELTAAIGLCSGAEAKEGRSLGVPL